MFLDECPSFATEATVSIFTKFNCRT